MREHTFLKIAEHVTKEGLRIALDENGELWICEKDELWSPLQFNQLYEGYYPRCRFADILYTERGFVVAGKDVEGNPIAFQSLLGRAWNRIELVAFSPFREATKVRGEIRRILRDGDTGQIFFLTGQGELVVLPDCPKCMKIRKVSDKPLVDGKIDKEKLELTLEDGSQLEIPKFIVEQFRVSFSYAEQKKTEPYILVNLQKKLHNKETFPNAVFVQPEDVPDWLEEIEKEWYIFFLCEWGIQADEAAHYARRNGWNRAYSLGGIKQGFHME